MNRTIIKSLPLAALLIAPACHSKPQGPTTGDGTPLNASATGVSAADDAIPDNSIVTTNGS